MEQELKDRFLEKINRIHDNSDLIILWEKEASDSLNIVDIKTAWAIFKAFQEITEDGLRDIGPVIETMAEAEMLDAHKNAVSIRLQYLQNNNTQTL